MSHITVKINGYSYTLGCEDGQEQHLVAMAEQVEGRIASIKALGGNTGEARLLVLASLLMADELHDVKLELEAARAAAQRSAKRAAAANGGGDKDAEAARRLARLATRAEQIATGLESPAS